MKKLFVAIAIGSLLLTGCKSTAAKNTESAIEKIGEVNLDSEELINEAQANYDALTDKQKDEVDNYKILVDAQNMLVQLREKDEAEKKAAEISDVIDDLASQVCRKQSDIDKLNDMYNDLNEEYRDLVTNADQIEEINELTQYESYALEAATVVKNSLKSSDSFKLKEIVVMTCKSGSLDPYYVTVRYSGTNSFGGELDKSAFVDIDKDGKSAWWPMSALLGGLKDNELLMYNDYLKHKDKEYTIDPERIISNMK